MQFIMVDQELFKNQELSNDEIIAYSLLCDRMKSSRRQRSFFDSKENDHYVIYTQVEMAKILKVSERKVNSIFKHLVKMGLVRAKKQFSKASRLFLPQFTNLQPTTANSAVTDSQNLQANNQRINQKNKSKIYTVNTKQQTSINPIEKWKQAVIGKIGLTESVVDQILKYTKNDLKRSYRIVSIINNARNSVVNENRLKKSNTTQFETNLNIKQNLATKLKYIFSYLPDGLVEQAKYMTKCLKKFFLEALGLKEDKLVKPEVKNGRGHINRKIPDWMKKEYDPEKDKVTEEEKEEARAALERIRKMTIANNK